MNAVTVINLFFIPMLGTYLFYKLKAKELKFSAEFLAVYMSFAAINSLLGHLGIFALKYLFNLADKDASSIRYALIAFVSAGIIAILGKCITFRRDKE